MMSLNAMQRGHLERLAAHIESLDSGSLDAKAIRWALKEIDRYRDLYLDLSAKRPRLKP